MAKSYVKSLKEYDHIEFDPKSILQALKKSANKKKPTSVALEEETIQELKLIAEKLEVPYQVVMRMFILEGIQRVKKAV
jgi:hypothetical protein